MSTAPSFLISKDILNSTGDVIKHCRTFEALKLLRITPKSRRLASVTSLGSVDTTGTLSMVHVIRHIVREELIRHEDALHHSDYPHDGCALQSPWPLAPLLFRPAVR